jgi:hypothetical protein
MKRARHLMTLLFTCFVVASSCSQKNSTGNPPSTDIFVGSTPCDSLIKSLLQIPSGTKCEFIKWELSFPESSPGTFQFTALYGEAQPNTNGFIGGGKKIAVNGKYTTSYGAGTNPGAKVYYLHGNQLQASLLLIQMDSNIFHFADAHKNFIVGNGGWGYVLNRIQ